MMANFPEKRTCIFFCFSIDLILLIEEDLSCGVPIDEDIDTAAYLLFFLTHKEVPECGVSHLVIDISKYLEGYILSMIVLLLKVAEVRFSRKSNALSPEAGREETCSTALTLTLFISIYNKIVEE